MAANPIDVLYVASFWASAASALLCIAAAIHLRYVRLSAAAGDGVAAQSAVLPALEPVVHTAALMFAVRWAVLDPGAYPLPPAWYNNAQYIGVAVDLADCLRYFLYWFSFEAVSIGVALLFTAEWLSTAVIRRCLTGGVAAGALLAGVTVRGGCRPSHAIELCGLTVVPRPLRRRLASTTRSLASTWHGNAAATTRSSCCLAPFTCA